MNAPCSLPPWLAKIEIRVEDALPTGSQCAQLAHDASLLLELCKAQREALEAVHVFSGWFSDSADAELARRIESCPAAVRGRRRCEVRRGHHPVKLSARQEQVLDLLELRMTSAEIAERLGIRQSTVRQHAMLGRQRRLSMALARSRDEAEQRAEQ